MGFLFRTRAENMLAQDELLALMPLAAGLPAECWLGGKFGLPEVLRAIKLQDR
jgi:hypothetical protein